MMLKPKTWAAPLCTALFYTHHTFVSQIADLPNATPLQSALIAFPWVWSDASPSQMLSGHLVAASNVSSSPWLACPEHGSSTCGSSLRLTPLLW